jgi:hypothetical protein
MSATVTAPCVKQEFTRRAWKLVGINVEENGG